MKGLVTLALLVSGIAHAKEMSCIVKGTYLLEQDGEIIAKQELVETVEFSKDDERYHKDFALDPYAFQVESPIKGVSKEKTEDLIKTLAPVLQKQVKDFSTSVTIFSPESGFLGIGKRGSWKKGKIPAFELRANGFHQAYSTEGVTSKKLEKFERIYLKSVDKDEPDFAANYAIGFNVYSKDLPKHSRPLDLKYSASFDCSKDREDLNVNDSERGQEKENLKKESSKKSIKSKKQ